ncbi:MAG: hypothetical protein WDW36_006581 [Sanguina aurantia]
MMIETGSPPTCAAPIWVIAVPIAQTAPGCPASLAQLTPEQASKIEPIIQGRQQQVAQLRADNSLAPRDLHQKLRALKQETDGQIQAILTDSQRQQYLQMQQAAMQKHRDSRQGSAASTTGDSPENDGGSN